MRAILLGAWLLLTTGQALAAELWVAPNHTAADWRSFLAPPTPGAAASTEQWQTAFAALRVFKFPVAAFVSEPPPGQITEANAGTAAALPLEAKRAAMRLLLQGGKKVALEVGGPYEFYCQTPTQVGESAAAYDLQVLDRIHRPVRPGGIGLGGRVDYLVMDGPISRIIDGGRANDCDFHTPEDAIRELLDYMRAVRARYADIGFVWLINAPNWAVYGDVMRADGPTGGLAYGFRAATGAVTPLELSALVEQVVAATTAAGLPLAAIHFDTPYDFSTPDRMPALLQLASRIRALGVPLGVAFNMTRSMHWDARAPFSNLVDPLDYAAAPRVTTPTDRVFREEFKTGAVYAGYVWHAELGGWPDHVVVQSFMKTPERILPESRPASFTNVVVDVAALVRPRPRGTACNLSGTNAAFFRLEGSNVYYRRIDNGSLCAFAEPTGDAALLEASLARQVEVRGAAFLRACQPSDPKRRLCAGLGSPVMLPDRITGLVAPLTSAYGCKWLPSNFYRMTGNGEAFFSNGRDAIVVLGPQSWRPPTAALVPLLNIPTNLCMRVDGALP